VFVTCFQELNFHFAHLLCQQKPDNTPDIMIGSLIALIVEPGSDWKNVAVPAEAAVATPAPTAADVTRAPPAGTAQQTNVTGQPQAVVHDV
jgi:hypothetical protein